MMTPTEEYNDKQQSILIVDDIPKNIQLIGNFLAKENLRIAYTTNGSEALRLASENNFDLFLLDIMMPLMDGYELCKSLKSDPHTSAVPVIFLTAKTDPESILRGFETGAQDYVTKPFNAAELVARVRTQLLIRARTLKLKELNETLEKKVQQRTSELELANREILQLEKAKSEFLSLISHELRTPLNGIAGLTSLLSETDLNPDQIQYLKHLHEASQRLADFSEIARLITSVRTRNRRVDFYQIALDILVEMAIDEISRKLLDKKINIRYQSPAQHINITGDSDLIRRSISILLESTANKMNPNGVIEIRLFTTGVSTSLTIMAHTPWFDNAEFQTIKKQCESESLQASDRLGFHYLAVKLIMDAHFGAILLEMNEDNHLQLNLVFNELQ